MDEVGELPMGTQVRLLRVLENGEIIRVGSSKAQKVNVRVVGATNADMLRGIEKNQFREDLFYRLNTVEINLPPLRDRKGDIHLLFRKFAQDFAQKYRVPGVRLSNEAIRVLEAYRWPGNIRQLRNLVEQLCVIENDKEIDAEVLKNYIPEIDRSNLPARMETPVSKGEFKTEREILYKVLFDMRSDISNLKTAVQSIIKGGPLNDNNDEHSIIPHEDLSNLEPISPSIEKNHEEISQETLDLEPSEASNSNLSLQDLEIEMIKRAIERHRGRRKEAAEELGISERTLYRKIKQYDLG